MVSWEEAEKLDYRALAKAGGRRELLKHFEYTGSSAAQPHPPSVDWFTHNTPPPPDPHAPEYKSKLEESWMTWSPDKQLELKLPKVAAISQQKEELSIIQHKQELETKLPQLVSPRGKMGGGRDGVDFGRLMSQDYRREWFEQRQRKEQQHKDKLKAKRAAQKKKLQDHAMKARKISARKMQSTPPKRFTIKKFADVPPKLKLPPL